MDLGDVALPQATDARRRLAPPGILLGLGLGGFVDGILFHQLLQWHYLLSNTDGNPVTTLEGLERNIVADGVFHTATWILTVIGLTVLWRIIRRYDVRDCGRHLLGWMLAGWGVFNLLEGVVNHHLLQIHHVRDDVADQVLWDLGFLASGLLVLLVGLALARPRRREADAQLDR